MLRINLCALPDVGLCVGKISIVTSLSGSKSKLQVPSVQKRRGKEVDMHWQNPDFEVVLRLGFFLCFTDFQMFRTKSPHAIFEHLK